MSIPFVSHHIEIYSSPLVWNSSRVYFEKSPPLPPSYFLQPLATFPSKYHFNNKKLKKKKSIEQLWLTLSQDGQGREICTTAAELANLLQHVAFLLHRNRGLAHKHLKDLGRKLLCRPAILRVTSSPTADAEKLSTLSIIIAVGPRGDNDLRDTGTVVLW